MWRSSPPVRLGIGAKALEKRSGKLHKNGRRHGRMQCFLLFGAGAPILNYDNFWRKSFIFAVEKNQDRGEKGQLLNLENFLSEIRKKALAN